VEHRVSLLDGAKIGGDVDAIFLDENEVDVAPGAEVKGEVRSSVHEHEHGSWLARYNVHYFVWLVIRLAAAFALGMMVHALSPRLFAVRVDTARDFGHALGVGFVALVATPIAILLVAVTLVGIPLAAIGLATYLTALYVSGILIAALVGTQVTKPEAETWRSFGVALLAGLAIVIVAMALPIIGVPVRFVVVLCGLGLLVERLRSGWDTTRTA